MKSIKIIFTTAAFLITLSCVAQKSYNDMDVFTQEQIIWYGLDFSNCKFVGNPAIHDRGYKSPQLIVKYFFGDWNSIPLREAGKYDIKGAFGKKYILNDIQPVTDRNKNYNPDSLITFSNEYKLNTALIPEMIKTYTGLATEGIGLTYIVECFDHNNEVGSFYIVLFDIATKKILLSERVTGKPAGANLKNYWAGAFRDALDESAKVYKKWKKGAQVK